jgi:hypothetical protein
MRFEELGLSAFIAGTALGYLIWYWARNGGDLPQPAVRPGEAATPDRETMLSRPRFQAAVILGCAFLILALFIGMAFQETHPMGPPPAVTLNHWIAGIAFLIVVLMLGALLGASVRQHRRAETYRSVFKATLAVVFGFVLMMFIVVVLWGPHSLYLSPAERLIAAAPLGALLLGVLFGSVGAEWLNYIMCDDGLKTVTMETQHRRWGYILLVLLLLGLLYPLFPQLLGKLSTANVTTPLGGVTFETQPVSTIRQGGEQIRIGNETSAARSWDAFEHLAEIADRDRDYAEVFFKDRPNKLKAIQRLHDGDGPSQHGANEFVANVLDPLGKCINRYFEKFNNQGLIQRRFNDVVVIYTKLLHTPKSDSVDATPLLEKLSAAAGYLNDEMSDGTQPAGSKSACADAKDKVANARPPLPTTLPYAAMGLSFLLYDSGETEQAMREIASWVEDHYDSKTVKDKIADCNKTETEDCKYYGYKPPPERPERGEKAKWEELPAWYRIRIEFELTEMLPLSARPNRRVSYLTAHDLVHTIESLFSESDIRSAYDWAKCSSPISSAANRPKQGTHPERLDSRMVAAYFSLVDKMLRNLSSVADEGLLDEDVALSPEMLRYAENNAAVELQCLSYYQASERETLEAEYKATYGILLTRAITQRESGSRPSEFERAGRREAVKSANAALRYAIPTLRRSVARHDREMSTKRRDQRLFTLLEEQDYLRRAEAALRGLEDMAR